MAEWDWKKNTELGFDPRHIPHQSNKKVWWKCSKGHEWLAAVNNRNSGRNCPYCSGKKVLKGYNDLKTVNPVLAEEWNYEKNGDLIPENFTVNSNKKVWWKCKKGHEWQTSIAHRNNGSNCPFCLSERHTSFPEYAFLYYLQKHGLETIHLYKERGYELDIYIPSKKVAIEYDGYYWHRNKTKEDLAKNYKCREEGIKLYRIREGLPLLNDSSVDYIVQRNQNDLSKVLEQVLSVITESSVVIDLQKDVVAIENLREYSEKEKSLSITNPEIASEWNYEKNGNLKPENFSASSNKKVWWKCQKGHEWQATINHRNIGTGCPYCSGKKALKGFNDLQTVNPALANEWNYEKNGELKPENFTANSDKKAWWKCNKGHEWQASISYRNKGGGCPYCAGRRILIGDNDLQTINPTLVAEWNYEKNGFLKPESFTANSGKKVWWKCSKGHEWQATIDKRNLGTGCPYCSGKKVLEGYNDLLTTNPRLASEWNYEKNGSLKPENVTENSHKKVWWRCSKGHEWQATIGNRNLGTGCPECAKKKQGAACSQTMLVKNGSLADLHPDIAAQWHPTKNGEILPTKVTCSTNKVFWWKCPEGHEWKASVASRTRSKGCPVCSGKHMVAGINDLATKRPDLAKQWHPTLNGELTPADVTVGAEKYVWWQCEKGHAFQSWVYNRSKGIGCPYCSGRKPIPGETDLATKNPKLATEWHPTRNGNLKPVDVTSSSGKKVWWLCSKCGHEWEAPIYSRSAGSKCPKCAKNKKARE